MPDKILDQEVNSEEVNEIITAVPSWILRWGITMVFSILGGIILLSSFINYPDIVKTTLKVNCLNAPKPVQAKQTGKLTRLLISEGQAVEAGQPLAYFESTAKAEDILKLNYELKLVQSRISKRNFETIVLPEGLNLGEIQGSYQNFYQQYLQYQATTKNGYYLNRMVFLEKDLKDIKTLGRQIQKQQQIQQLEYTNQEEEYKAYQKLYKNKVISRSEFSQQENKYLSAKYPLQQSETAMLTNLGTYSAKEKELLDLRHTIAEEQSKFVQALNQCITESDNWMMQHILTAPVKGHVSFAGIVQQNQNVQINQEVFVVNPGNTDFFGEIQIPQYNMGKIKKGAKTLVKMRSYPYEQYGIIRGRLTYISDVAYRDSVFIAKVSFEHFENKDRDRKIVLKTGMQADAEIITEESSLLQRFFRNITKMLNNG
ncbi:HlyD family efflux transporter periplasmic adaptor subunit [Pedobacter sp. ISL-68]|uniref:HlyD family efflux transporter periplasmic adaptor subunit n=1 Tax=unclassified Pedobacter TaxID=2628915 RepID=UPI001BE9478B|nr:MULTISPECIES: HlyD family efflux transporter periplasmic adaptor subunit [unclassified Pedobacter]MBT2559787.1 HlyD family efflux transporter periplasmic adaptor subunit [Pedobacter sp. ISL-64]MBT2592092.1 HlyD family efflux transporter periplasmic adaptor subunit [Pedobacter sp. ISL-68]